VSPQLRVSSGRPIPTESIPDSDLANIRSLDVAARGTLAEEVRRACTDIGFFYGSVPTLDVIPALDPDEVILVLPSEKPWDFRGNHRGRHISLEAVFLLTRRGEARGMVFVVLMF